jgi:hypothetical protein
VGQEYDLEEGDTIAETKHFIDHGKKLPVTKEKAELDPNLAKKTLKFLANKYPEEAKKIDLRTKGAHRSMVYEIMKSRGMTIESTEDEGKTMAEQLVDEKQSKLAASRKR